MSVAFENTYARLPERFHARVNPVGVAAPRLIELNVGLAGELGIDVEWLRSAAGVGMLAGNVVAEGSEPLAIAYAGHQFGHFVPALGDGRANLLGEVRGRDGTLYDLQLKGSGPTPFSRRGDGRAALGPVLREYLVSEAMAALGVPTTRALAAVWTGEMVQRETMQPGGIVTRVAGSHLRVGTFQYFAARGDTEGVRVLAEYALERHYPEVALDGERYRGLLAGVVGRHARLVARWMGLGFVHGVMNTDNTSISGETLDYGPCAFLEGYDPGMVFSSIDHAGRYGYGNQASAALWNLTRLAEALLPLLAEEKEAAIEIAKGVLAGFEPEFQRAYRAGFQAKLGLVSEREGDWELGQELLGLMAAGQADFSGVFRGLAGCVAGDVGVERLFREPAGFVDWVGRWRARVGLEGEGAAERIRAVNPVYIPRNHLVEEVIQAGVRGEFGPFRELLGVVTDPFVERDGLGRFAAAAREEERVTQTFCGT